MASSSSEKKSPMPSVNPAPAPAPEKTKKTKRVINAHSRLDALMKVEEWEPLQPIDEEWLKNLAGLIPNGEQYFADRGFTVERSRELDDMSFVVKAQTDLAAEIQEQLQEKGYVEMEVTDEEEEEEVPPRGQQETRG